MNPKYIIWLLISLISIQVHSQDTVRIGESYYYSSEEVSGLNRKGFAGDLGQENIRFSENHIKVEYCYYSDSVRNCYGYHFWINNDSTLIISDSLMNQIYESWTFKKVDNGNFYVYRVINGFLESGRVDNLIPLNQIEPFVTTSLDKKDTLWWTNDFTLVNRKWYYYTTDFNTSEVNGKIYDFNKVDAPPTQLNGDSLSSVEIKEIQHCFSQSRTWINTITCVITKEGEILNIEQALGGIEDNCSYTMMEINRKIYNWGKVKPAIRNGVPVNVRWFIKIDDLSQPEVHPAYLDTYKNRREYLKRRKQFANNK